jgi:AcrR family transcriptional regulator
VTIMEIRHPTGHAALGSVTALAEPRENRPDARTRILDEAERLFRHYGYTKTTVADIARDLGMSPDNVYRFFASKAAIHEALADRMLAEVENGAWKIARLPLPAAERLRLFVVEKHKATVATMLDEKKVHEMVSIALEEQWAVIERHLDRVTSIIEMVIKEGIASGEFADQDAASAARCFFASVISVCHPQIVAQCLDKPSRATPEELAEFAINALKA